MKSIKINIIVGVILTFFYSCSDYLEYDPQEDYQVTQQDYLAEPTDYETMAVSCYSPMGWMNQLMVIGDVASDNAVAGGESSADVPSLQQLNDLSTLIPNNDTLEGIYIAGYEGINRTNYLIQYKNTNIVGESVVWDGKDELYGEIYFLRAYYYFNLVKSFGDLVLFTDRKIQFNDFGELQRSSKEAVYAQIEADLLAASAALPETQSELGRVTKYSSDALLAKVYLYQNKFDEAAGVLSNVNSWPFSLMTNIDDVFLEENENGVESILEVQYSNTVPYDGWAEQTRGQGNYAVQQCGIRGLSSPSDDMPYASGWSTNLPKAELATAYEDGDQRRDATCFNIEQYIADNPSFEITYQVAPFDNTGLYNKKYLPRLGQSSGTVPLNYGNNQRIIRYAEVLLIAAEANLRSSTPNVAAAQVYLDMVRDRAFGDTSHRVTATVESVLNERRLELAMEGDRFFDLVRTGQASDVLREFGFVEGKHEVFPIPQSEINISSISQNPGY